jgi:hypothetical protein
MIPIQHDVHDRTTDGTKTSASVSFSPEVKVHNLLHINDYTKVEMAACWYSLEEYKETKTEIKYIVGLIENKELIDEEQYCQRGIVEYKTQAAKISRCKRRMDGINAVLNEQCLQRQEGVSSSYSDGVRIYIVYREHIFKDQLEAYLRGMADEQIARTTLDFCSSSKNKKNLVLPKRSTRKHQSKRRTKSLMHARANSTNSTVN